MTMRRKLRPYRVNKAAEVLVYRLAVSLIRLQHSLLRRIKIFFSSLDIKV